MLHNDGRNQNKENIDKDILPYKDSVINEKLKMIQEANFNLLLEIYRICEENNINIFLEGGTLLGAVRHSDFIPWDDDVDLAIKRVDYENLLDALKRDLNPNYELVTYKEYNGYFWDFITGVQIKNSQLRNETEEDIFYDNKQNRICVDIFVLDNVPNNTFLFQIHLFKLKVIYGLAMGHRYKISYSKYSFFNKLFVKVLSNVGKRIPLKIIFDWFEKLSTKYDDKNKKYVTSLNYPPFAWGRRFKTVWFENSVKLPIRESVFLSPAGYDEILKVHYGDYMKLPSIEKRLPEHGCNSETKIGL